MSISVIIPSYNEEKNIHKTIESCLLAAKKYNTNVELICIDDCSDDNTGQIIEDLSKTIEQITYIRNRKNQGFGGSFWTGVKVAKKKIVVLIPGDNENNLGEIIKYQHFMKDYDMVVPYPINISDRAFFRLIISKLFLFIINFSFRVNFRYTNGTVMYKKAVLDKLNYRFNSFMFQTCNLILLSRYGKKYIEVPYKLNINQDTKKTSAFNLRSILQVFKSFFYLLWICYSKKNK